MPESVREIRVLAAERFEGDKLGDDCRVMDAIAPFVEDGSFVEFVEVDGRAPTRWDFNGGQLQRSDGVRIP